MSQPLNWVEKYHWEQTSLSHIWWNVTTKEYHFSREDEQLDEQGYKDIDDCQNALRYYCYSNLR